MPARPQHLTHLFGLSIITLVLLTACASNRNVTIHVRDASTRQPVAGARVRVQPLHFFQPSEPYAVLHPFPASAEQGTTDTDGRVRLPIPAANPHRIVIISEAYPLQYVLLAPQSDLNVYNTWRATEPPDGHLHNQQRLEIRFTATDSSRQPNTSTN